MTTHRMLNRRTLITALGVGAAGISLGTAFAASAAENNNETGFRYFTGKGLSAAQAAGIIGNFIQESQRGDGVMHPARTQDGGGPGRGIAQWTAGQRWATLVSYANQQGRDPWSLSLQLDFVWHELRGTHVSAYNALVACGDVRSATLAFSKYYEGCGICHNDRRVAFAQQVYARYGSGGGGVGRRRLRPGGQQRQDQPRGGDRDLGAVNGPGLTSLKLASGAHVLTQHLRQGAQQRPQVGAADLVGQAQGLNDPVGDRVGETGLESVQGAVEAGGGGVVGGEGPELGADGLRAALTEVGQRLRQAHARADTGDEGVDSLGPHLAQPGAAVARP